MHYHYFQTYLQKYICLERWTCQPKAKYNYLPVGGGSALTVVCRGARRSEEKQTSPL